MDSGEGGASHPNWKALATAQLKWKVFVQAKSNEEKTPKQVRNRVCNSISGDDAKQFYEDLLQTDNDEHKNTSDDDDDISQIEFLGSCKSKRRKKLNFKKEPPHIIHKAMKYAQNDEEGNLLKMLHDGLSVNLKDEYGWSLLMVAACGGAKSVVRTLLERKAKTGTRDSKGNTAIYLASMKGHHSIVDMLIKCNKRDEDAVMDNEVASSTSEEIEEFQCNVCNITIKSSTRLQHETSIVHQFKLGSGNQKTFYGISPSNKGFQMLINQGWDTEKGLGPQCSGAKYPVKTALKEDRKGIGATAKTSLKVTHFGPGDTSAIKGSNGSGERIERQRTISRKERKHQKMKEKRREIDIRRALSELDY